MTINSHKYKIALVSYNSLGDGLLNLMLAKNLYDNGYDVIYYNSYMANLQAWFPWFPIQAIEGEETIYTAKEHCDLMILDPLPSMYPNLENLLDTKLKGVTLINQKLKKTWRRNNASLYADTKLKLLANSQSLRDTYEPGMTMVDVYALFMQRVMKLESTNINIDFVPPSGLVYKRNKTRIIIFPYSPNPKKNWFTQGFVTLSKRLIAEGMNPVIVMTSEDKKKWDKTTGNYPCLSRFESIHDLAAYIYESGLTIANDSGGGHLASFLGIETISIYKKLRPLYVWRPGWANGEVVNPIISPVILRKRFWNYFIPITKIVKLSKKMITQ